MTWRLDSSEEDEIRRKIEDYKKKRKEMAAIFLIGMFGIYVLPFRNFLLILAIVSFGIAPLMAIYYTWKKHQLEKKLEEFNFDGDTDEYFA